MYVRTHCTYKVYTQYVTHFWHPGIYIADKKSGWAGGLWIRLDILQKVQLQRHRRTASLRAR